MRQTVGVLPQIENNDLSYTKHTHTSISFDGWPLQASAVFACLRASQFIQEVHILVNVKCFHSLTWAKLRYHTERRRGRYHRVHAISPCSLSEMKDKPPDEQPGLNTSATSHENPRFLEQECTASKGWFRAWQPSADILVSPCLGEYRHFMRVHACASPPLFCSQHGVTACVT